MSVPIITPITMPTSQSLGTGSVGGSTNGSLFQNILSQLGNGVNNLNNSQIQNQASVEKVLTGQSTNLQTTLINLEKAQLDMSLAVQVRDKLTQAYNSIMTMQI